MDKNVDRHFLYLNQNLWSGILFGLGLIAFFDEVVFHQLLHWHHFYDKSTTSMGLISDGLFHAFSWFATIAGLFMFADLRRRQALWLTRWWGGVFLGGGAFQLYDGIIQHKLMRIHQIRYVENVIVYDVIWNVTAVTIMLIGVILVLRTEERKKREEMFQVSGHEMIHPSQPMTSVLQLILATPFLIALFIYLLAVILSNQKYKTWPIYRTGSWIIGNLCVLLALTGPLAQWAHTDFTAHMIGHLLLGMLGPLLMVLAAPMTLIFRILHVKTARRLTKLLKSRPLRVVTDPIVASLLNVGGLWILYTTPLYTGMHDNIVLHGLIHLHVFLAGYVFTLSMINMDPNPHQTSYAYRSVVLVVALAGHGILSKYLYAYPPTGVFPSQAETGAMLMYYGGDIIDAVIIVILCLQWYRSARPAFISI